ncbi:proteophosphoglycan 5 [Sporothrix brasiliensis 5110]|uniref:Proteophosphoglycan 5 n=1 Tax=Sporothrix brasiliensis 5110 TaxID=1398154 RepID=A0A0C2INR9_9PEZI|nr:proteophosphoglycan 5 [Sporothrix brasiliensis 5110]KIH90676.1 proteophosphoglycan 5 [Sporothrix brasiliensis 5110]
MPDPLPTEVKQTPNRRKPGAGSRRPNRKNYASENDVAKADPTFQPDFAHDKKKNNNGPGPSTPQKTQKNAVSSKSPAPASQAASGKAGNRSNRNQQNNNPNSPSAKPGRRTPPHTVGPKPAGAAGSVAAFAGATFHASPAPSSLPLPSFFTKADSPGTPSARPLSGLSQQPSPPASDTELPSATATNAADAPSAARRNPLLPTSGAGIPHARDESPLDILFRADRAEKERNRRASSANIYGAPSQAMADNSNSNTFPRDLAQQQQQQQQQQSTRRPGPTLRNSSSGISAAELDGTPGQPMGPAFSTPFQDRIRAARPAESNGTSGPGTPGGFRDLAAGTAPSPLAGVPYNQQLPAASVDDRSEALKRFLFSKTGASAPSPPVHPTASAPTTPTRYPGQPGGAQQPPMYNGSPYQNMYSTSSANGTPNHQGYPNGRPQATPSRPNGGNGGGSSHIAAMEDSLRQILKLDSPFGGAPSPGIYRQS